MGTEIERKFLVHVAHLPALSNGRTIAQGYLSDEPAVRVRYAITASGGAEGFLTVKGRGTISRAEFEYTIPPEHAEAMLALCRTSLRKVRYLFHGSDGHEWEIDKFEGAHAGLWLAEIELSRVDEDFERPQWLGLEVTEDPRYTNVALARAGLKPEA